MSDVLIGGIEKREIVIVDYDPLWPERFQKHSNNGQTTPMKVMKMKIETSSLLLGAFAGAVAVLCVAAATTKTNAGAALEQRESGDTTAKEKEVQMEQVTGIGGVFFKVKDPKGMTAWYRTNLGI